MSVSVLTVVALRLSSPGGAPSPRWGHAMTYDAARDRVVLFGGALSREAMADDPWEWDGARWSWIEASGPSARGHTPWAFDRWRGMVVLHGGRNEERIALADTWEWDGMSWTRVSTEGPPGRDHDALVFDEERCVAALFGGYDGTEVDGDTWQWDDRFRRSHPPGGRFHRQRRYTDLGRELLARNSYDMMSTSSEVASRTQSESTLGPCRPD